MAISYFRMLGMTAFALLAMDFVRRSTKFGIPKEYNKVLVALFISLAAIYARSVFRTVELIEGWSGYLMEHEAYFIALDGALMVVAVLIFLPFDPAWTIPRVSRAAGKESTEMSDFSTV
ncbi:hypothetical protein F4818DRAFT_446001 [Hypoxylon cercidicola]|nr:hypothetical protein F4818DRAFT_446001 [Hypoxylon cercidicola]